MGLTPVKLSIPQTGGEKKAMSGGDALYAKNFAEFLLSYPVGGGGKGFFRNFHVVKVRVQDVLWAGHDPDMALPEHQIAAAQRRLWGVAAQGRHLLIAVARAGDIGGMKRDLHKAGTIKPRR